MFLSPCTVTMYWILVSWSLLLLRWLLDLELFAWSLVLHLLQRSAGCIDTLSAGFRQHHLARKLILDVLRRTWRGGRRSRRSACR